MSNATLFSNFTVLQPDDDKRSVSILRHAFVAVASKKISYVGTDKSEAVRSLYHALDVSSEHSLDYEIYDGKNRVLLPTFANAHSHLPMTLLKNSADDLKLEKWLFDVILPREDRMSNQDIYYGALLGWVEMINGGIGATADMYPEAQETAKATLEAQTRINLCHDGKYQKDDEWFVDPEGMRDFINERITHKDQIRTSLLIHSIYLYPKNLYSHFLPMAESLDVPIHLHLSETRTEVENAKRQFGMTPTEALNHFGLFNRPCLAAHAVHLNDNDRSILKEHNVSVAHNPSSNMKLASGVCDVNALLQGNINVCLGTDGSASNNNLDMFLEMRHAALLAKVYFDDASYLKADKVLYMATRAGYLAMGFDQCGLIRVGMNADLQIIDCDHPSMWPINDPISAMVYSAPSDAVESVMVNGDFVKYRKALTTLDYEKIKYETSQRARRILNG